MTREDIINAVGCGTQIAEDAARHNYTPILVRDNGLSGDKRIALYDCNGVRVIDTNGDAAWEEADPSGFASLLAEIDS